MIQDYQTKQVVHTLKSIMAKQLIRPSQLSPRSKSASTFQFAADPSPPPKRKILLFGYWPPTNIGRMLAEWKDGKDVGNFFVQSFSPTFTQPLGWDYGAAKYASILIPWWGPGNAGDALQVDYRKTSQFFWNKVNETKPIAIMSFSRSGPPQDGSVRKGWFLERYVYNYAQSVWLTKAEENNPNPPPAKLQSFPAYYENPTPAYPPVRGTGTAATPLQRPAAWNPPYAGGDYAGSQDYSPYGPGKPLAHAPNTGNPPDPIRTAVTASPPPANSQTLEYDLPTTDIINAIHSAIATSKVAPSINTDANILGNFVSAYMAYHSCWYREYTKEHDTDNLCKKSGHTHVDLDIHPDDATTAVSAQLTALIGSL